MKNKNNKKRLRALFIPEHINNPFGLAKKLLLSKNRSARFALLTAALGVATSPLDWIISKLEKPTDHNSVDNTGPHIFVCGPARSGTTFMYQVLSQHLDVSYTRNLCALLPRSSATSAQLNSWIFKKHKQSPGLNYENYYGKTRGFSAPCEANHLWNQWVDPDASKFRTILSEQSAEKVARYYQLLSHKTALPTLAKNNNANVFADAIINTLPNSYFICLRRKPAYLAQSLIRARIEINGDPYQSYGVVDVDNPGKSSDPYNSVLDQIDYLNSKAEALQKTIGDDRFWIVDYEEFCANPTSLINRVKINILNQPPAAETVPPFPDSNRVVNKKIFARVTQLITARTAVTGDSAKVVKIA